MQITQSYSLKKGTVLKDSYVLGSEIGSGGYGIIYSAYDTVSECKVAIKEYFPIGLAVRTPDKITVSSISQHFEKDYVKGRERFLSEAMVLSELNINVIIRVYDIFTENGTAYYVMEYVEGMSIAEYTKKYGAIKSEQALFAALNIADAFTYIHDKNIIHRDLSPDNIMITHDGNVKIIDFGNAREFSYDNENSFTVALKHGFAPLEQYQHHGNQGPWTDIYSLGAVMYYALTLNVPQDPMTRMENYGDYYKDLSAINPQLAEIIEKMTAINPDDRYTDSNILLRDLRRVKLSAENFNIYKNTV